MNRFELLSMKLDRVKELMDATGADMETMMGSYANDHCDCHKCVLYLKCESTIDPNSCAELWTSYLKGDSDGKT